MFDFNAISFSWLDFFLVAALLVGLYFLLRFIWRLLKRPLIWSRIQTPIKAFVYYLLLLYEPIAIILLASMFVMINPPFHGLIVAILFISGFTHVSNYLSGRLVMLDATLLPGRRVVTQSLRGIISEMGRLGIYLQTQEGRHFINYSRLVSEGYAVDMGEDVGGYYDLHIQSNDAKSAEQASRQFMDLLFSAPYLDGKYKPEHEQEPDQPDHWQVKVLVKEEIHLHELISLIREWGYTCKMVEN